MRKGFIYLIFSKRVSFSLWICSYVGGRYLGILLHQYHLPNNNWSKSENCNTKRWYCWQSFSYFAYGFGIINNDQHDYAIITTGFWLVLNPINFLLKPQTPINVGLNVDKHHLSIIICRQHYLIQMFNFLNYTWASPFLNLLEWSSTRGLYQYFWIQIWKYVFRNAFILRKLKIDRPATIRFGSLFLFESTV